jgi:hypothetical protein
MRYFLIFLMLAGCAPTADVIVPVSCPKAIVPVEPIYPTLSKEATPRQVMEYFLINDAMKSQRIEQLEKLLGAYE